MLLISCSQRKCDVGTRSVPAIDLYDGGAYRILKKLMREGRYPRDLDVWILSAQYGLIHSTTQVTTYELRMTKERAAEIAVITGKRLEQFLWHVAFGSRSIDLCVSMGAVYKAALPMRELPTHELLHSFRTTTGGIGTQLGQLRNWVIGDPVETPETAL